MNHLKSKKLSADMLEEAITEKSEELIKRHNIKLMTTLGLRGRTLTDSIIIVDEAQNFSPSSAQTALTRIGENCMVIVIGSSRQIDNTYLNKYTTGLAVLLGALKHDHADVRLFGAKLTKVVRGRLTEFAEKLFTKDTK
jgi:PhoH-like ATPase